MIKSKLNPKSGERLKEVLEKKGITQAQLAKASNFSQQYISYIITGKKAMSGSAAKIFSDFLEIRQEYLLCEDDFETWLDLETFKVNASNDECKIVINYLHTLGVSVTPLIALPENMPNLSEQGKKFLDSLDMYDALILDKNGNEHKTFKFPLALKLSVKDAESMVFKRFASRLPIFVVVETENSKSLLSLKEFSFFLKNIDEIMKFNLNNFIDSFNYFNELHTPESIKDILNKDTEDL